VPGRSVLAVSPGVDEAQVRRMAAVDSLNRDVILEKNERKHRLKFSANDRSEDRGAALVNIPDEPQSLKNRAGSSEGIGS